MFSEVYCLVWLNFIRLELEKTNQKCICKYCLTLLCIPDTVNVSDAILSSTVHQPSITLSLLDCLFIISFFSPFFSLPSLICISHFYYISLVVFHVFLSSVLVVLLPLLFFYCFLFSSFCLCVFFILLSLTNFPSTSFCAPVIPPLFNPHTFSAVNPLPPQCSPILWM